MSLLVSLVHNKTPVIFDLKGRVLIGRVEREGSVETLGLVLLGWSFGLAADMVELVIVDVRSLKQTDDWLVQVELVEMLSEVSSEQPEVAEKLVLN